MFFARRLNPKTSLAIYNLRASVLTIKYLTVICFVIFYTNDIEKNFTMLEIKNHLHLPVFVDKSSKTCC